MNSLLSFTPFRQSSRLFSIARNVRSATFCNVSGIGHSSTGTFLQPMRKYSETVAHQEKWSTLCCCSTKIYYSRKHEYVILESNAIARVGLSNYAQDKLGDVVYVQLPELDRVIEMNEDVAAVESVKAASEVYSPVSGTITDVNKALETDFALINKSPLDKGWIFKVSLSDKDELKSLMNKVEYEKFLKNEVDEDDDHH